MDAPALGGTEVHDVDSVAVGDTFRIFVGHCGVGPRSVLLVTDANGLFGLAVDTVRMLQLTAMVPPMLVVGVGYPTASTLADTVTIRARDLTPTPHRHFDGSGGASRFLTFLREELDPWLDHRFPDVARDTTYFGSSLGGLFGTSVLLTQPEAFDRYILASPSLWWDDELAFRLESQWADAHDDLAADVFFGIGAEETDAGRRAEAQHLPDTHPAKPPPMHLDMVDDLRRFHHQLSSRRYPSLRVAQVELPGEFHVSAPGVVLSRGLRHFHFGREVPG